MKENELDLIISTYMLICGVLGKEDINKILKYYNLDATDKDIDKIMKDND